MALESIGASTQHYLTVPRPAEATVAQAEPEEIVEIAEDRVEISSTAVPSAREAESSENESGEDESESLEEAPQEQEDNSPKPYHELDEAEKAEVTDLKKRDQEVKAHEKAHLAAGGQYTTGGANYEYETGPDGKKYAVGGEVGIDVSPEDSPEKTIEKARTIRKAALAPAKPSNQDRKIAAEASRMEAEARRELSENKTEEAEQSTEKPAESAEGDVKAASKEDNTADEPIDADQGIMAPPEKETIDMYV